MKRKELILLENRLRKLLKEDTITDPDTDEKVEVAPGVILPPKGPSGFNFDGYLNDKNGLKPDSYLYFNSKLRRPKAESGKEFDDWTASPYDGGVVRYENPHGVVMYFYAKPDVSKGWPDINGLMGNTSHEVLNTFTSQVQWNNFVKRINSKKDKTSSVGVTGVDKNTTTQIQQFISDNFKDYVTYLGTKPVDGYWGVKTDEAILRIIHDIEQKTKPQTKMTAANVGKAQSKTSKIG